MLLLSRQKVNSDDSNFFKVRAALGLITVTGQLLCAPKIAIFLITTQGSLVVMIESHARARASTFAAGETRKKTWK